MRKPILAALVCLMLTAGFIPYDEPVDLNAIAQIKAEGLRNSQVMQIAEMLTDVNGPRLTNSPGYRRAAEYARDTMAEWGLDAKLEYWGEFGVGWSIDYFHVHMVEPHFLPLIAWPKAWVRGTDGEITGVPKLIEFEDIGDLEKYKGKLKGAIVMSQSLQELDTVFEEEAHRLTEEELAERMSLEPRLGGGDRWARWREWREQRRAMQDFVNREGIAAVIEPTSWDEHNVRVGSGGSYEKDGELGVPQFVVSAEHYNRLVRMIKAGRDVTLNLKLEVTIHDENTQGYNVIADLPGTDPELKDEVVIIGGHLDSWHPGTGAVDNASGCAVAMEAVRLIKTLGLENRRTIRVALWDGEEQGLHGSRGYVARHYADRETMETRPDYEKFSVYFNMDNGTGLFRGIHAQGNGQAIPIFEAWIEPLKDLGISAVTFGNTGSTDHIAFDAVGLPGFQFIQDPISYMNRNHHASMDVYDQLVPEDMVKNSIIMASFALNAANRDELFPRKPKPEPASRNN